MPQPLRGQQLLRHAGVLTACCVPVFGTRQEGIVSRIDIESTAVQNGGLGERNVENRTSHDS